MFNVFFRPYVPGFRVGPNDVPGFNIDDNGLPQRANASSDGTLPDSAAQPYPDTMQTQSPPSISFRLPGAEGWVLSAPLIGSPGFRVSPQDDVPGFNVRPLDDAPGFNLDENGVQQPETPWSDGLRPGSVAPQHFNVSANADTATGRGGTGPANSAAASRVALQTGDHAAAAVVDRIRSTHQAAHRDQLAAGRSLSRTVVPLERASTAGGHTYPLPCSHQAEHQSPTAERESVVEDLASTTHARLGVCPKGQTSRSIEYRCHTAAPGVSIDAGGQACCRAQLHPCARWRAAGAATDAVAAISADATENAVGSTRYWAGYGPPA